MPMVPHPRYVFWIGYCLAASNQKEAISRTVSSWHMKILLRISIAWFWIYSRASSGPLGRIFDREAREEAWMFRPLCCVVWKLSDAIFWGKIASALARCWSRSKVFPPFSFLMRHSRRRRQNPTKSLKISLLRQKDDSTPQVRQFNFYLALFNTYI